MKFKPEIPGAVLPTQALAQDYAQARNMGKVHLGEQCLYLRKFSGVSCLPYSQITRAWLRQEEVKARMCCATANFDQLTSPPASSAWTTSPPKTRMSKSDTSSLRSKREAAPVGRPHFLSD